MEEKLISSENCEKLLLKLHSYPFKQEFNVSKNTVYFYKEEEKVIQVRLPIFWNSPSDMKQNQMEETNYVLLMIRSGIASIGYFENGENIDHRVFRAYMVRKKQGKSQIKHLKTKGKSRAGSRIRLAETLEFFDEINERLQEYFKEYRVDKVGLSCTTTLIPYLFDAKVTTPFEKNDARVFKIPKHIANPTYESLLETNSFLKKATIQYNENYEEIFYNLNHDTENISSNDEDEDW
ncbi:hypothetical protein IFO69_10875 [Echinicola sp. CAU 1574]|uniref:VLRF1 domain-containing protein n=1 Tax=Echinicola arenosa TaxID=2774144 RepID=A0ABR9AKC4_9BACT|nr:hypothetical protein [Echinicola arenosa]MBD8489248.1 hypothetical protein [Echinicola arenosa]